jgi:type IV secretory pathway VirB10-like protein
MKILYCLIALAVGAVLVASAQKPTPKPVAHIEAPTGSFIPTEKPFGPTASIPRVPDPTPGDPEIELPPLPPVPAKTEPKDDPKLAEAVKRLEEFSTPKAPPAPAGPRTSATVASQTRDVGKQAGESAKPSKPYLVGRTWHADAYGLDLSYVSGPQYVGIRDDRLVYVALEDGTAPLGESAVKDEPIESATTNLIYGLSAPKKSAPPCASCAPGEACTSCNRNSRRRGR